MIVSLTTEIVSRPEPFQSPRRSPAMFDHVSIGVRDLARTKRFYDAALKPLGYTCTSESAGALGYGAKSTALWISPTKSPVPADEASGLHFCFAAPNPKAV